MYHFWNEVDWFLVEKELKLNPGFLATAAGIKTNMYYAIRKAERNLSPHGRFALCWSLAQHVNYRGQGALYRVAAETLEAFETGLMVRFENWSELDWHQLERENKLTAAQMAVLADVTPAMYYRVRKHSRHFGANTRFILCFNLVRHGNYLNRAAVLTRVKHLLLDYEQLFLKRFQGPR